MSSNTKQVRAFAGPAILSYGFLRFFLFGPLLVAATFVVGAALPLLVGLVAPRAQLASIAPFASLTRFARRRWRRSRWG